jgi:hypothetical protein
MKLSNIKTLINELYYTKHSSLYPLIKPYLLEKAHPINSEPIKKQVALFSLLLYCEELFLSKYNLDKFNLNHLVEFLNFFSVSYLPEALKFEPIK